MKMRVANNDDKERPCKVVLMKMKVGRSSVDEGNKRWWKMMMSNTRQWRRWWWWWSFSTRNDCDYRDDGLSKIKDVDDGNFGSKDGDDCNSRARAMTKAGDASRWKGFNTSHWHINLVFSFLVFFFIFVFMLSCRSQLLEFLASSLPVPHS